MPPSQLKRLKSSLREQGVTGPPKSKKQKKSGRNPNDAIKRTAALQTIRDSFNPFEVKVAVSSRPPKFQHANSSVTASTKPGGGGRYKQVLHRPGVTKSAGETMRRENLLPEMQRRNKVGGVVDRRIGEGDPGLTSEERAVQRFAREKASRGKGAGLFDLEGGEGEEVGLGLTHGGMRVDDLPADDFGEDDVGGEAGSEDSGAELVRRKRRRDDVSEDEVEDVVAETEDQQPELKRSRKEIMEEVISKSKFHKYERQKTREDDEDIREELDKGMDDILTLLRQQKPPIAKPAPIGPATNGDGPIMNPDRQKLLNGMDRSQADKEYDARMKQLAQDVRAKPSERTKTAEEKVRDEAERLRGLEERRMKRMRGEQMSDDDEVDVRQEEGDDDDAAYYDEDGQDEAAGLGFTNSGAPLGKVQEDIVLDEEEEFDLDGNLIASGSEADLSDESASSEQDSDGEEPPPPPPGFEDEEDEFVRDILGGSYATGQNATAIGSAVKYTYPCPRSHEELLDLIQDIPTEQLPTIIQRIRGLYHPSLSESNKESMADFSTALVDHLSYMGLQKQSLLVAEQVIRHLHSLSRAYPEVIAAAFRKHLQAAHERKDLHAGDLVLLIAIGSIYPTNDHFHQVVTPAVTVMARWLAVNVSSCQSQREKGAFLVALCVRYLRLSGRYVPEAVRYTLSALDPAVKHSGKEVHIANLVAMAELWRDKPAFLEIFSPALPLLKKAGVKKEHQHLQILLQQAKHHRRPLELHHHRPLPIRTSIPKFEEAFNPDKHYDPDKERSDAKKLQKEYKREKKGALRELRKDANFISRQQLSEKKARDAEYDRKYRRLVAEVQGQEGHEGRVWEREKARRKGGR